MPSIPLSPKPSITRWETWLNAVFLYENNFEKFKNVIESLTDDAVSVKKLKHLVQDNAVKCALAFIKLHLPELSMNFKNSEESNSEPLKSMDIFRKIEDILTNIPGPNRKKIKYKCLYFKYAPITSFNVERSFSLYTHILSNRRFHFYENNLEMYLIINFNSKI
jgi:hypothetical protein